MHPRIVEQEHDHIFNSGKPIPTNISDVGSDASPDKLDSTTTAPWRSLFFFTTKANIPILVAGLLASIISGAVSPAQSFLTGRFFEKLIIYAAGTLQKDEFKREVDKYVHYLVIVAGISWIAFYAELALWIAFGELQAKSARDRLFHGLLRREIEWFDLRKHGIGALLPRLQTQIRALQLATSQPLGSIAGVASTAILSLVQAFVLSWKLTLVTISTTPVLLLAVGFAGRGLQHAFDEQNEKLTEAQKIATNAFTAIETVKCFNGQSIEQRRYNASIAGAATWYYRVVGRNALQQALVVLLSVSMFVQGFYYGGILIARGEVSSANVITTFMSALAALQAINAVLPQIIVFGRGRNAGLILRTVIAEILQSSTPDRVQNTLRPGICHGAIEVKNVTFAYPSRPRQWALRDVSMFIPAGKTTFLIGRSGSGKSTLGQLLVRFYASFEGQILFDGIDLSLLDVQWLRKNITLVEQTSSLFDDTIYQNIALGKHDPESAVKEDVDMAVQFALLQSLDFDLPAGLETMAGYKGSSMSGGQRQRIALARARLRDTPVLILDESTSALDHISRSLVMDAIRHWRAGKTTIVITHDISQIFPNDYLYILEHGSVVQAGCRKHLEELRSQSFLSFLTTTTNARSSPKTETVDLNGSSACSSGDDESDESYDPTATELVARGSKRISHFSTLFQNGSPILGFQTSPFSKAPPWSRAAVAVPPPLPPLPSRASSSSRPKATGALQDTDKGDDQFRNSMALESIVQHAGKWAADSRRTDSGQTRRRPVEMNSAASTGEARKVFTLSCIRRTTRRCANTQPRVQPLWRIMSTLWPSIDRHTRVSLVAAFVCATITAVSTPVFSYLLSKMLKLYSVPGGDRHKSLVYAMAILGISVISAISTYAYHFCFEYAGQRCVDSIRSKAVERILDQPREFFEKDENGVSRLADCLDRNAEETRNLLGRFSSTIWMAILMTSVSIIWALIIQWKMTLVALAAAPYIFGVAKAFGVVSEKWEVLSNNASEDASATLTETFVNIRTVRALTLERYFTDKYTKTTNRAVTIGFRRALCAGFFYGISDSASSFTMAMVYYVGAKLVTQGVPADDIMEVFVFLIFALGNLNGLWAIIPQITTAKDMASRLLRLASLPKDSHEHLGNTVMRGVGDIAFNDVKFAYPSRPEHSVLNHLNMHIRPGTCTAIVGASGSGKSTIANLLLNLYCISDSSHARVGALTIAGRNIKRIEASSLRTLIVPVSQTPTLFPASIHENITYALPPDSPYNTFSCISAAAVQAGIHDFINSLPQGYNTDIGEGGMGISGGQAQRIAIARALVRRPSVLILDEATSALDVESAVLVRNTIKDLVRGRSAQGGMTVIIITHSREMMEIAEKVVVLESGRVVEQGSFDGLMKRKGAALVNLLSGGEWTAE